MHLIEGFVILFLIFERNLGMKDQVLRHFTIERLPLSTAGIVNILGINGISASIISIIDKET